MGYYITKWDYSPACPIVSIQYNQVSHNTSSFEKNPSQSQTERTQNIFGQTGAFVFLSPIHATRFPFGNDLMRFHLSSSLKRRYADESGCFHLSTQKMERLSQLAVFSRSVTDRYRTWRMTWWNFSSYTEMKLLTVCDRNLSLFNVGPFLESHGHFTEPESYFKI